MADKVTTTNSGAEKYRDVPEWVFKKCTDCIHAVDISQKIPKRLYCKYYDAVYHIDLPANRCYNRR